MQVFQSQYLDRVLTFPGSHRDRFESSETRNERSNSRFVDRIKDFKIQKNVEVLQGRFLAGALGAVAQRQEPKIQTGQRRWRLRRLTCSWRRTAKHQPSGCSNLVLSPPVHTGCRRVPPRFLRKYWFIKLKSNFSSVELDMAATCCSRPALELGQSIDLPGYLLIDVLFQFLVCHTPQKCRVDCTNNVPKNRFA